MIDSHFLSNVSQDSFLFHNHTDKRKVIGGFLSAEDSENKRVVSLFEGLPFQIEEIQAKQVHGNTVVFLNTKKKITEFSNQSREKRLYDGLMTNQIHKVLIIKTADCVPILFYNLKKQIIGAIHCGWKPLSLGIISQTFSQLHSVPHTDIKDFYFYIGPAICQKCYEVGEEVTRHFAELIPSFDSHETIISLHQNQTISSSPKYLLNLKKICQIMLQEQGLKNTQIEISKICTRCHPAFYSYRKNQTLGRNINFISLI